jgi:hypothetical protein
MCFTTAAGSSAKDLSELEKALHLALNKHDRHGGRFHHDDDQRFDSNNHGLINTIVNHNNKLKIIENKFNLMVDNFANASQLKEVAEKHQDLEKHIFGTPRPHKSWREAVLLTMLSILIVLGGYSAGRICIGPWLIARMRKHVLGSTKEFTDVGARQSRRNKNEDRTLLELKVVCEKQMQENARLAGILEQKIAQQSAIVSRTDTGTRLITSFCSPFTSTLFSHG